MAEHLGTVDHGYIRYANCWEDADLLTEALAVCPGHRVLSIGSAGDNSFSLLVNAPALVLAVDINPVQLHLIELKKAAIAALEREEYLRFLGFRPANDRAATFKRVAEGLPDRSTAFWMQRMAEVEAGLIGQGKFERYFELFRKRVLPLVHGRKRCMELLAPKSEAEQERFHRMRWDSWRWRALFKVFFSRLVMGRLGRDPAFLKQVEIDVGAYILGRAQAHLRTTACQRNEFLEFIWNGTFAHNLPHYVRPGNYERIRAQIGRLHTFEGLAEAAFRQHGRFDRFNLSNIFEYMPPDVFAAVTKDLVDHATPGARLAYWNLMVPRRLSAIDARLAHEADLSASLTARDKGFFYRNLFVDRLE